MTTSAADRTDLRAARAAPAAGNRPYWAATGLFCALFLASAALTFADPAGTRASTAHLGFPTYLVYPQAVAKVLGVLTILSRRSRALTNLAFAGFLYDLLLALAAHIHHHEAEIGLAAAGLVVWTAAYVADRRRFPPAPGY